MVQLSRLEALLQSEQERARADFPVRAGAAHVETMSQQEWRRGLTLCAKVGDMLAVRLLMAHAGAHVLEQPDHRAFLGSTLHLLIDAEPDSMHPEIARLLLAGGASAGALDEDGFTLTEHVGQRERDDLRDPLREAGAL
jgi:hypothetical protein